MSADGVSVPGAALGTDADAMRRSGFIAVVGRPNVGKSTLMNALVGTSVATTSAKPQTTRRTIRGIVTTETAQIVLVDTPGVHRPRSLLGERLNEAVYRTWAQVDAVAVCLPANEAFGRGDAFILEKLQDATFPLVAIITKADAVSAEKLAEKLVEVSALEQSRGITWAHIVPVSAKSGKHVGTVVEVLASLLPMGPLLYPEGQATDDDIERAISDVVRQAALEELSEELPHSLTCMVEEIVPQDEEKPDGVLEVRVNLYVERDSQKGIIIGKGGSMLKHIGSTARPAVAELLGRRVHLALFVKVAKEWQSDPSQLRKLGFDDIG